MKIAFSVDMITDYFQDKRHYFSIAMVILAIIASLVINKSQAKKIESLSIERDAETKISKALFDIGNSEKAIKTFMNSLAKKDIVSITDILTKTAKASNIALESVKKSSEENRPLYTISHFTCVMGADRYHEIGKFISDIENHPGVFYVDSISIKAQDEGQEADKELFRIKKERNKFSIDLIISIIAFKG